jgi:hypothetical protein
MVAVIMLAQPMVAGQPNNKITLADGQGDLTKYDATYVVASLGAAKLWPANSPVQKADYLDVREASIEKQGDTFVLTMTMWCGDLLADVEMPIGAQHGKQIAWIHYFINLKDGSDYEIGVWWDGSRMLPLDLSPDLTWSIIPGSATITMSFNEQEKSNRKVVSKVTSGTTW